MTTFLKIHPRRRAMKVSQGIHCWLEYHKLHSKKHSKQVSGRSLERMQKSSHHGCVDKRPEVNPSGEEEEKG